MYKEFSNKLFKGIITAIMLLSMSGSTLAVSSYNPNSIGLSGSASILDLNTAKPSREEALKLRNAEGITNSNARITISLRDSDVKQVLRMLADKAHVNIIFHESVEGKVTLDLKNVTLNEAFFFVLSTCELTYYTEGKTVFVATSEAAKTSTLAKQVLTSFPIKYVNSNNVAKFLNDNVFGSVAGVSGSKVATSNPRTNEVLIFGTKSDADMARKVIAKLDTKPLMNNFKVTHTTPKQMADLICKTLFAEDDSADGEDESDTDSEVLGLTIGGGSVACKAKVEEEGEEGSSVFKAQAATIVYMEQAGEVGIYGGSYEQAMLIRDFIARHDKKAMMALIELNIVELNEAGSNDFNTAWAIQAPFASMSFTKDKGLSFGTMNVLSIADGTWNFMKNVNPTGVFDAKLTLSWLIKDGKGRTVANPKIMATNGQTSTIDLTSDYVSKVTTQMSNSSVTGEPVVTKDYEIANDNGLKIEITPFISPAGYVSLDILPEYASIKQKIYGTPQEAEADDSDLVATLLQRRDLELKNVRIKDGETLILAGFVQEIEAQTSVKFPFLSDLPLVGNFFRNSNKTLEKEEMVIMITPHIVYDDENLKEFNQKNNIQL